MLKGVIKTVNLLVFKRNLIFKKLCWVILLGTIFNFTDESVLAQANHNEITINQNTITEPLTIEGISGGAIAAEEITQTENTATGYCDGYVSRQPNHFLELESFLEFLRLEVESQADTTILVKGPGGVWCNDDAATANPMIEGQWQPGLYQVWVGSYQADSNNNYQIKITIRK